MLFLTSRVHELKTLLEDHVSGKCKVWTFLGPSEVSRQAMFLLLAIGLIGSRRPGGCDFMLWRTSVEAFSGAPLRLQSNPLRNLRAAPFFWTVAASGPKLFFHLRKDMCDFPFSLLYIFLLLLGA